MVKKLLYPFFNFLIILFSTGLVFLLGGFLFSNPYPVTQYGEVVAIVLGEESGALLAVGGAIILTGFVILFYEIFYLLFPWFEKMVMSSNRKWLRQNYVSQDEIFSSFSLLFNSVSYFTEKRDQRRPFYFVLGLIPIGIGLFFWHFQLRSAYAFTTQGLGIRTISDQALQKIPWEQVERIEVVGFEGLSNPSVIIFFTKRTVNISDQLRRMKRIEAVELARFLKTKEIPITTQTDILEWLAAADPPYTSGELFVNELIKE